MTEKLTETDFISDSVSFFNIAMCIMTEKI